MSNLKCEKCEWYKYPLPTSNNLISKPIQTVITEVRRCERGWCNKERRAKDDNART